MYLYMYALIQDFIMVERFAVIEVVGLEAGTQFCSESGTLDRCEIAKLSTNTSPHAPPRPTANPFMPGGCQRNLKSRGTFFGNDIRNRALLSWGSLFFGNGQLCIAKRSCSCRGVYRGHITTQK